MKAENFICATLKYSFAGIMAVAAVLTAIIFSPFFLYELCVKHKQVVSESATVALILACFVYLLYVLVPGVQGFGMNI